MLVAPVVGVVDDASGDVTSQRSHDTSSPKFRPSARIFFGSTDLEFSRALFLLVEPRAKDPRVRFGEFRFARREMPAALVTGSACRPASTDSRAATGRPGFLGRNTGSGHRVRQSSRRCMRRPCRRASLVDIFGHRIAPSLIAVDNSVAHGGPSDTPVGVEPCSHLVTRPGFGPLFGAGPPVAREDATFKFGFSMYSLVASSAAKYARPRRSWRCRRSRTVDCSLLATPPWSLSYCPLL